MATTEETESAGKAADDRASDRPDSPPRSKPEFLWDSLKRGLSSILTAVKLYLLGIIYQLGGGLALMLIAFAFFLPWFGLETSPEAVRYLGTLVFPVVTFTVYGAVALKFEDSRASGREFDIGF